jgi:hypothetical protein
MNKETSKQARIIDDVLIAEYNKALSKFNEEIKTARYKQTLTENFIADWADVMEYTNKKIREEI